MYSKREAFKIGFLQKCAEEGLTPEETRELVADTLTGLKIASVDWSGTLVGRPLGSLVDAGIGAVGSAAKGLTTAGLVGAAALPPAIGVALGLGHAGMTDTDNTDLSTIKKRELIDEYRRQTQLLQSKRHRNREA